MRFQLRISNNDKSQSTNEETNLKEEIRTLREKEFQIDKEIDALITELVLVVYTIRF